MMITLRKNLGDIIIFVILLFALLIFVGPFIWMVLSSIKPQIEIISIPPTLLPQTVTFEHYARVFQTIPIVRYYLNSLFLSVTRTSLIVFTSTIMGYVLAKYNFRFKNLIFMVVMGTMMLPFALTMIPVFMTVALLGWVDSYKALIIPGMFSSFGIFLMRQAMYSFPSELREAARIDGCGEFKIFFQIVIPLSKAPMAALAILVFMETWDEFFWPLIVLQSSDKFNIPLGLASLASEHSMDFGLIMAGATISVLPIIIVFFFAQKHFIASISIAGIKG